MIGTTYKAYNDLPEKCNITKDDIAEILDEINNAYKNLNLKVEDVTNSHVGLQAMPSSEIENEFDIQPETHSLIFNHSNEGNISNLVSIKSVKYTTAPSIAEDVVKTIKLKMKNNVKSNLKVNHDPQLLREKFFDDNKNFDKQILERLWNIYGNNASKVINYMQKDDNSKRIIFEKENICLGEIKYCIVEEMASTAQDIIDRRLGLSALEKVSDEYYSKLDELLLSK
jgi:glycerol-3-phosphate dehydrogenase